MIEQIVITYAFSIALLITTFVVYCGFKKWMKFCNRRPSCQDLSRRQAHSEKVNLSTEKKVEKKLSFSFEYINERIPELVDCSITELYFFIQEVDKLVYDTDIRDNEQLSLICSIVKRKVKGSVRECVQGLPSDWKTIRMMLLAVSNIENTTHKLRYEMSIIKQGEDTLDLYYIKLVKLMLELIIRSTENAKTKQEAIQIECKIRKMAQKSFIKGTRKNN